MNEIYRLRKGNIFINNLNIVIQFGLVFEEDGVLYFEIYLPEEFDFVSFFINIKNIFLIILYS